MSREGQEKVRAMNIVTEETLSLGVARTPTLEPESQIAWNVQAFAFLFYQQTKLGKAVLKGSINPDILS